MPRIEVINKGIGGETAAGTLARLDRDVLSFHPDLVIWQLGTNDALRNVDAKTFGAQAVEGIRRIRESGADLMLLEPQFLPKQAGNATYAAYVDAVRALGAAHGAARLPAERGDEILAGQQAVHPGNHAFSRSASHDRRQLPLPCPADGRCDRADDDAGGAASRPIRLSSC